MANTEFTPTLKVRIDGDYADYIDDAKEALGSELEHTEEALTAKATELMQQAEEDFRDEHGFFPTVAYRHN